MLSTTNCIHLRAMSDGFCLSQRRDMCGQQFFNCPWSTVVSREPKLSAKTAKEHQFRVKLGQVWYVPTWQCEDDHIRCGEESETIAPHMPKLSPHFAQNPLEPAPAHRYLHRELTAKDSVQSGGARHSGAKAATAVAPREERAGRPTGRQRLSSEQRETNRAQQAQCFP
eukprot:scaffold96490_cov31-Tisochrysis_lutea.AAC.3